MTELERAALVQRQAVARVITARLHALNYHLDVTPDDLASGASDDVLNEFVRLADFLDNALARVSS